MAFIFDQEPSRQLMVVVAKSPFRIGRGHECDLVLPYQTISRVHVELVEQEAGWVVRNRSATNPVLIDGQVIIGEGAIQDGQRLSLGEVSLGFTLERPPETSLSPATVPYGEGRRPAGTVLFAGQVATLADTLSLVHQSAHSGRLSLVCQEGRELSVWFHRGDVIDAEFGTIVGQDAIVLAAQRTFRSFILYGEDVAQVVKRIRGGSASVVLELARRVDEESSSR